MKLNNITSKIIIISDMDYFPFLFKYKGSHPELNIKLMDRNTLLDTLAYRFKEDPIPYLIRDKGIEYSKAKKYLNLLRLGIKLEDEKLKSIFDFISPYLIKDEYGLFELQHPPICLFEMDEDRDITYLLKSNGLDYQFLHFEDLEVNINESNKQSKIINFSDKFAQFSYIFAEIRQKLLANPALQNNITVLVKDSSDIFYIHSLAKLFGLETYEVVRTPLKTDPTIAKKIKEIYENKSLEIKEEEKEDSSIQALGEVIKKYHLDELTDFDFAYLNLMEILSSQSFDVPQSNKGIIISSTYLFNPDDLIYITNYEFGCFYKEYADNNVISDAELDKLGLTTSYDKTALDERKKRNYIRYNQIQLFSRVKQHGSDSIYDSHFVNKDTKIIEEDKVNEINKDGVYTSIVNPLIKAIAYDQFFYREGKDGYCSYDNSYKGVEANELMEKEVWSITNLERFIDCPFKYYVDELIKLDDGDMHHAYRGNLIHSVLEDIFHEDFDFDTSFNRGIEAYKKSVEKNKEEFGNKEQAYIEIYRYWLKRIIPTLLRQKEHMQLINETNDHERKISFEIGKNKFKGVIDKMVYTKNGGNTFYTIVDYKTGFEEYDPLALPLGKSSQLPLYYYAIKDNEELTKGATFGGFLIQHTYFSTLKSAFVDKNILSEAKLLNSIKYNGVHLSNESYLKSFDDTYLLEERKDKGGSFLDDKMGFSAVNDDSILLKKVEGINPTRFNIQDTVEMATYAITLIIESIRHNVFNIAPSPIEISKPVKAETRMRCQYCEHRNICFKKKIDERDYSNELKAIFSSLEVK